MKAIYIILFAHLIACTPQSDQIKLNTPQEFLSSLIPDGQLAHGGVFSPDGQQYYLTLSDKSFQNFDVLIATQNQGKWMESESAFFNTPYDEHGVSFSANGQTLYFSSTKPTGIENMADTWHIWSVKKEGDHWGKPEFINLPTMENKLVSHPSFTQSNRMYFHAGGVDYSDLAIYYTDQKDGNWQTPTRVQFESDSGAICFTPFIAPDESYLLFGIMVQQKEKLFISYQSIDGWQEPKLLIDSIQINNRANPFVNLNDNFLYFATGEFTSDGEPENWFIKRMEMKAALNFNYSTKN